MSVNTNFAVLCPSVSGLRSWVDSDSGRKLDVNEKCLQHSSELLAQIKTFLVKLDKPIAIKKSHEL